MNLVSQAEFARMTGKSAKTISKWKQAGRLVLQGDEVDVEASRAKLDKYRKGGAPTVTLGVTLPVTHAQKGNDLGNKTGTKRRTKTPPAPAQDDILVQPGESIDAAAERLVKEIDVDMSMDEARRLKEVYLVLLHRLDFEQKSGALIDLDTARSVFFETHHAQRDTWLNWPSKVAPLIASTLKIDNDTILNILTEYVHKQVTELGEPQADFSSKS